LGTWCSDSQMLIPDLYHYLKRQNKAPQDIVYYGLDESKTSSEKWEEQYDINFVPTIIFIDKQTGVEKGRIIEHLQSDLATDIYNILQSQ
jgi:thiol-disulfide isomerase/thioredoxin